MKTSSEYNRRQAPLRFFLRTIKGGQTMISDRHRLALAAASLALIVTTDSASAQDWPTRPVTMVVPFAAGGPLDALGRILAPRLGEILGQQVVVANITGAGGMIRASRVAKA